MKLSVTLAITLSVMAMAAPTKPLQRTIYLNDNVNRLTATGDSDEVVAYPDEKLYAEEYKRETASFDDKIAYPDEKLYAEEYKREPGDSDEQVAYPDEKLYAEEYKRSDLDENVAYPDEKLYAEEYWV